MNADHQIIEGWSFGGGTAMMIQIDHRESHDVDIFLPDPQFLSYLDPQKQNFEFEVVPHDYGGDGTGFLKIAFADGEIDFIVGPAMTEAPTIAREIENEIVLLETVPEIITKKIYYRGSSIKPRDIFDIAAAGETDANSIISALRSYPKQVEQTLATIDKLNPEFVYATIQQLMLRDHCRNIATTAIDRAKEILRAV
ncbi:nucleotidyl transferase AbiEii/AbiGii toxin family protein (plasmid) [Phyllobacterium sp. 628]|nr:nucleotidyl transferase AbiEii/AbiGii toxin family protein [Phyllobacterium sp. 628]